METNQIVEKPKLTAYEKTKIWRQNNREKFNAQMRRHYSKNPQPVIKRVRAQMAFKKECHRLCMIDIY